jgi:CBS domain-containing protein
VLKKSLKASELASTSEFLRWGDSLLKATNTIVGDPARPGPYRLPVLDQDSRVEGIISGRRILEIFLGRRGESIRKEKGMSHLLSEIVGLFCDEAHNLFDQNTPADAIISFMKENEMGILFLTDEKLVFKGTINEMAFLSRMRGKRFNITVDQVMKAGVQTTTPDSPVIEAAEAMVDPRVRRLPGVDHTGVVIGLIAVADILQNILETVQQDKSTPEKVDSLVPLQLPVSTVMRKNPVALNFKADIGEAADLILESDVSTVMLRSNGELSGIISRLDIIAGLTRHAGVKALVDLFD